MRSNSSKKRMHEAVISRCSPVSQMTPAEFFELSQGGEIVPAGSYTAFRHALSCMLDLPGMKGDGLFLFIIGLSPTNRLLIPTFNIVLIHSWRCADTPLRSERLAIYNEWVEAGHWSPYGAA